ncbi:MAG: putative metal-binding motif-containing protein [Nanoarchaeota archaeon]|nr:putative metal-binding motif-containing protein [Nanoarchaeota archaeon]
MKKIIIIGICMMVLLVSVVSAGEVLIEGFENNADWDGWQGHFRTATHTQGSYAISLQKTTTSSWATMMAKSISPLDLSSYTSFSIDYYVNQPLSVIGLYLEDSDTICAWFKLAGHINGWNTFSFTPSTPACYIPGTGISVPVSDLDYNNIISIDTYYSTGSTATNTNGIYFDNFIGTIPCACTGTSCNPANNGQKCDGCIWVSAPAEVCGDGVDNDCDGLIDEDCNVDPVGNLDGANCEGIWGWARDPDYQAAGEYIDVHFYADGPAGTGTYIGAVTANQPSEVGVGGNGNHRYSFLTPVSVLDGMSHDVYVYAINNPSGNNPVLTGSPNTITPVAEICDNGYDDDCDGLVDYDDVIDCCICSAVGCVDVINQPGVSCNGCNFVVDETCVESGWVNIGDDCDDTNPDIYAGAPELCDGIDNQCSGDVGYGEIDEGCDVEDTSITDCGFRLNNGTETITIACEAEIATSPARVYKNSKIWGLVLVDITDSSATQFRVQTKDGVKALMRFS